MIEVNEDHIIATSREIGIKHNRANCVGVRMGESLCALGPTPAHNWHPEHGAAFSHSQGIRPDALDFYRNERRLLGQFESNSNQVLNTFRREVEVSFGFVQNRRQPLDDKLAKAKSEGHHSAQGFRIFDQLIYVR